MSKAKTTLFVMRSSNPRRNIILRRGPTKQTAVFNWNRTTDQIELGQWIKAKLYHERGDISPDGRHWIYFAMGRSGKPYTVMARTPYATALDYFPEADTWTGGGSFQSNTKYSIVTWGVEKYRAYKHSDLNLEVGPQKPLHDRLKRNGWRKTGPDTYEKEGFRDWRLQKNIGPWQGDSGRALDTQAHDLGRLSGHSENFEAHAAQTSLFGDTRDVNWADFGEKSIEWAKDGCLWRAKMMGRNDFSKPKLIRDFNNDRFEQRSAPY